ncbi:ribosome hibernation factor-recruiting GTPase MRF [Mycobacterium montefiorense]|uniref:ribosome hibernation factor-recruiting GTPase MRF n=1 Tax=Mycobacterium montefiorense TaxID=154654 RepID=UPI0021F33EBA|nr:GTP-binding protein [Mycobacterium montefiorense]MCV7429403.1 GTP-binding protein [Mycobacterium montefiorense]
MRTPVVLVAGQGDTDAVTGALLRGPGTVVVEHRFDGHVVRRTTTMLCKGELTTAHDALELAHGCVACTVRNDLLLLLRKLAHHAGVERIVVHLSQWMEPEPICVAINHVRVRVGPGYPDGPAALDVAIACVVTCIDFRSWLTCALGEDDLPDGRTMAQVVVGQAEFADLLVLTRPEPLTLAVLRRLAPRARITVGLDRVDIALANLEEDSRRGRSDHPHGWLLAGRPPLGADGTVRVVEFNARRPFHPERLHAAVDLLLTGVVRARGRLWLASRPDQVMWLESAGGGMRVSCAGKWLAAMTAREVANVDAERRLFAELQWEYRFGDRHTAMTVLVCGGEPPDILDALHGALLTDAEMADPREWRGYLDPFGEWHEDPCDEISGTAEEVASDSDCRES